MSRRPYRLTGRIGSRATFGLIVLQVDETIEHDFHRLFDKPDIALHVSRIPSGAHLTPETIATMETTLPAAAALLPPAARFDAVGYACTSGATLIGAGRVAALVHGATTTNAVTDPLTAALAALRALDARSVGIVSPYIDSVSAPIRTAFEAAGIRVPATLSFGEDVEARVARIDPASIRDAALEIGRTPGLDAIFLSCTNLRTLDLIDDLEVSLGLPVISSNQTLAWHMAQHVDASVTPKGPGRLVRGDVTRA
ncbi:maleate cis-trans isomerase family protein [Meridianimarinicoccus sp. RP-17]|uniref:maleate cis-trans isomerase family protein n=1 Tax=Meridianimarinicoccus zhengii TaxID=2056810 RepID=UPI000DADA523|nr:aspartate/glutamate racemase family protein [Phycocomes zhengii]